MAGIVPFGCGHCLPCRVKRRREWMWRQFLEGLCYEANCFVTLTYDRASIAGNWQLQPRDLRLFIKMLRHYIAPQKIRFFAVGEYGEKSFRPHFHLSVFGLSQFARIKDRTIDYWIQKAWGKGFIQCVEFNHLTAQYVAGYTTKKLQDVKDGKEWIVPEFARMSNRPGIGAPAMVTLGRTLLDTYSNWESGDVPAQLLVGKRHIPLGRYLLTRLRGEVGFSVEYQKQLRDRISWDRSVQLQDLFNRAEGTETFKSAYVKDIEGYINQVEARASRFPKRSVL